MENSWNQYHNRRITTAVPSNYDSRRFEANFTARVPSAAGNNSNSIERLPGRSIYYNNDFSSTYDSNKNISALENYRSPVASYREDKAHNENPSYRQDSANYYVRRPIEPSEKNYSRMGGSMTNDREKCGLIILGNAGVGKSFLGNILLGCEAFVHDFSVGSVTHATEYYEIQVGDLKLAIFNIPGLIEADQKRIDLNKREIEKAFLARPNSIILYVFGNQRGRLRDEDIVAFNAINAAYSFRRESLVLVMNDLDNDRPSNYEGTTLVLLRKLLPQIEINEKNVCFLNRINRNNPKQRQILKEQLLAVTVRFIPTIHRKKQEIQTTHDQVEAEKRRIQKQQAQFEAERSKFLTQIQKSQARLNETIAKHQTEAESYRKAIERQNQMMSQQQEEFERERRRHISEMNGLRDRADKVQREYDQLRRNNSASRTDLRAYETELNKLRSAHEELSKRVSTQSRKKSGCVIS